LHETLLDEERQPADRDVHELVGWTAERPGTPDNRPDAREETEAVDPGRTEHPDIGVGEVGLQACGAEQHRRGPCRRLPDSPPGIGPRNDAGDGPARRERSLPFRVGLPDTREEEGRVPGLNAGQPEGLHPVPGPPGGTVASLAPFPVRIDDQHGTPAVAVARRSPVYGRRDVPVRGIGGDAEEVEAIDLLEGVESPLPGLAPDIVVDGQGSAALRADPHRSPARPRDHPDDNRLAAAVCEKVADRIRQRIVSQKPAEPVLELSPGGDGGRFIDGALQGPPDERRNGRRDFPDRPGGYRDFFDEDAGADGGGRGHQSGSCSSLSAAVGTAEEFDPGR
jgi:hypothetical protein